MTTPFAILLVLGLGLLGSATFLICCMLSSCISQADPAQDTEIETVDTRTPEPAIRVTSHSS
jgi:hypothetical protein